MWLGSLGRLILFYYSLIGRIVDRRRKNASGAGVRKSHCKALRGAAAAVVAPESRAKLLMLDDAAHMTIFSHPTRIAEAVDELWGGALRYEEEL